MEILNLQPQASIERTWPGLSEAREIIVQTLLDDGVLSIAGLAQIAANYGGVGLTREVLRSLRNMSPEDPRLSWYTGWARPTLTTRIHEAAVELEDWGLTLIGCKRNGWYVEERFEGKAGALKELVRQATKSVEEVMTGEVIAGLPFYSVGEREICIPVLEITPTTTLNLAVIKERGGVNFRFMTSLERTVANTALKVGYLDRFVLTRETGLTSLDRNARRVIDEVNTALGFDLLVKPEGDPHMTGYALAGTGGTRVNYIQKRLNMLGVDLNKIWEYKTLQRLSQIVELCFWPIYDAQERDLGRALWFKTASLLDSHGGRWIDTGEKKYTLVLQSDRFDRAGNYLIVVEEVTESQIGFLSSWPSFSSNGGLPGLSLHWDMAGMPEGERHRIKQLFSRLRQRVGNDRLSPQDGSSLSFPLPMA